MSRFTVAWASRPPASFPRQSQRQWARHGRAWKPGSPFGSHSAGSSFRSLPVQRKNSVGGINPLMPEPGGRCRGVSRRPPDGRHRATYRQRSIKPPSFPGGSGLLCTLTDFAEQSFLTHSRRSEKTPRSDFESAASAIPPLRLRVSIVPTYDRDDNSAKTSVALPARRGRRAGQRCLAAGGAI